MSTEFVWMVMSVSVKKNDDFSLDFCQQNIVHQELKSELGF